MKNLYDAIRTAQGDIPTYWSFEFYPVYMKMIDGTELFCFIHYHLNSTQHIVKTPLRKHRKDDDSYTLIDHMPYTDYRMMLVDDSHVIEIHALNQDYHDMLVEALESIGLLTEDECNDVTDIKHDDSDMSDNLPDNTIH